MTDAELSCKELTQLITDYLEERLSVADSGRFEQHLSICQACVTYVEQMRTTIDEIGRVRRVELPQDLEANLREAFRHWKNG